MVLPILNPDCTIAVQPLQNSCRLVIVDNLLANPEALVAFAAQRLDTFRLDTFRNAAQSIPTLQT